jgi:hypothetical protein
VVDGSCDCLRHMDGVAKIRPRGQAQAQTRIVSQQALGNVRHQEHDAIGMSKQQRYRERWRKTRGNKNANLDRLACLLERLGMVTTSRCLAALLSCSSQWWHGSQK